MPLTSARIGFVRSEEGVTINAKAVGWQDAFRAHPGRVVGAVLGCLLFFCAIVYAAVTMLPSAPAEFGLGALICSVFLGVGVLALLQLRGLSFEARLTNGELYYRDTRPYQPFPQAELRLTPDQVMSIRRVQNGLVLRLGHVVYFDDRHRRSVRLAQFLAPDELDLFEDAVRSWWTEGGSNQ